MAVAVRRTIGYLNIFFNMGPPLVLLLLFGILNCALAFPAKYVQTDSEIYKEEHCLKMTPQREEEIDSIILNLSNYLYNLTLQYDHLDIRLIKIIVESHSENETEEKETEVQLVVNDCAFVDSVLESNSGDFKIESEEQFEEVKKEKKDTNDKVEEKKNVESSQSSKADQFLNAKKIELSQKPEVKEDDIVVQSPAAKKEDASQESLLKHSAVDTNISSKQSDEVPDLYEENVDKQRTKEIREKQSEVVKTKSETVIDKSEIIKSNEQKSVVENKMNSEVETSESGSEVIAKNPDEETRSDAEDPVEVISDNVPEVILLDLDETGSKLVDLYEKKHGDAPLLLYVRRVFDNLQYLFLN